jgi:hypothetical protein
MHDWRDYLRMSEEELSRHDIAAINLAFAIGLPGSERIDLPGCLRYLDFWARKLGEVMERLLKEEYPREAEKYAYSVPLFRMANLVHFLKLNCGVFYNPARIEVTPENPDKAEDLFIFGAIQGPGGTCGSLPVVFTAVARRLGYPVRLVTARRHVFCRWDDPYTGTKVNLEGTNPSGVNADTDDYYRTMSGPAMPRQELAVGDLISLTPRRELALFLGFRAEILESLGEFANAIDCYAKAAELEPTLKRYPWHVHAATKKWWRKLHAEGRIGKGFVCPPPARIRRWQGMPWPLEAGILALEEAAGNK